MDLQHCQYNEIGKAEHQHHTIIHKGAERRTHARPASLDALCRRFEIDLSVRTKHGALLDAELLADVYLELVGGRQPDFELAAKQKAVTDRCDLARNTPARPARPHSPKGAEALAHDEFLEKITDPIWRD